MNNIKKILEPIALNAKKYIENMQVEVLNTTALIKQPLLKDNSAIIGIGGDVECMFSISFDKKLLEKLVAIYLEGEKLEEDEAVKIFEGFAMESANIIVGNSIHNPTGGKALTITPPVFASTLSVFKSSKEINIAIDTKYGRMFLSAIYPYSEDMNNIFNKKDS